MWAPVQSPVPESRRGAPGRMALPLWAGGGLLSFSPTSSCRWGSTDVFEVHGMSCDGDTPTPRMGLGLCPLLLCSPVLCQRPVFLLQEVSHLWPPVPPGAPEPRARPSCGLSPSCVALAWDVLPHLAWPLALVGTTEQSSGNLTSCVRKRLLLFFFLF